MNLYLTQTLQRAVQLNPDATATLFRGRSRSYGELGQRVARLAGALHRLGMKRGDRVGMLALNTDRTLEYYMAVWWAGGVVNPVNTRWSANEMVHSLDDCGTAILFVDDQFLPLVDTLRTCSKALRTCIYMGEGRAPAGMADWETLLQDSEPVPDALRQGEDLAGVFYTGGTTGRPKGVMLSHSALALNSQISLLSAYFDERERLLQVAPLFHLAGLSFLLRGVVMGCTQVIVPGFTVDAVLEAIERDRITHLMAIPAMLQVLVDDPRTAAADLSSVRFVGYGASPITVPLLERAFAMFPQAEFVQGYGMTELSAGVSYLTSRYHTPEGRQLGKLASAGQALAGVDIRIGDGEGRELPRGEVGEIMVRSPCVMQGYWNLSEQTAAALRDGWMHTGDAGRMDAQGFVFIVDRFKDMIVSGGENVYCAEVEGALAGHPEVAAVAVIGVPSASWGESVHAVVVRRPGATADAEALMAHCRTLIAGYKCPRSIEFIEALPISGAGKVMKYKLREPHWAGQERRVG
ncbi:long-chain-fatty-acid--CoA ligase [Variovorax ginsengisoli]|uniref:Acyl-CoA synthetase (AMP-forming)/AMP-acid ligase II n=1 Tax=Variovorax ginsengisoli TaxID=363844 RepID=A0ABT9S9P6_9BURK|nr:long-chain-fatty-acid--CoA ligase [Variovorax ginsengisoli]MDP9901079.1 acyl-CoA synthetase (AMP-forming)/AMP-acid ligase II [Variovorax ginsengisoli]